MECDITEAAQLTKHPRIRRGLIDMAHMIFSGFFWVSLPMRLHPLNSAPSAHHLCPAGELNKMVVVSLQGGENREGHDGAP